MKSTSPRSSSVLALGATCVSLNVDAGSSDAELLGHVLGDVDVEAGERSVRVLQAQAGLVELDADDELAVAALVSTCDAPRRCALRLFGCRGRARRHWPRRRAACARRGGAGPAAGGCGVPAAAAGYDECKRGRASDG